MTATLGCGDWSCTVSTRAGVAVATDVPVSQAQITRRLSQVGEAQVDLVSARLCADLDARSWSHEVVLYRDGAKAWEGPIVGRRISGDRLTLRARDVATWLARRFVPETVDAVNVDAAELGAVAVDAAMLRDPSPRIAVQWGAIGVRATRSYAADDYVLAQVALDDAQALGADWIVVGRTLLVGTARPSGVVAAVWGDHWADEPDVEEDGLTCATRVVVSAARNGRGAQPVGAAADAAAVARFGLLEQRFQDDTATSSATAAAAASTALGRRSEPSVFVAAGTLSAQAPVAYGDLVPGVVLDATVRGAGTIRSVVNAVTTRVAPGAEGVAVDLEAVVAGA